MNTTDTLPTWDLTPIYASPEDWERDFARLTPLAQAYAAFRGRLAESPQVLNDACQAGDDFARLSEKVTVYATLKSDENTLISENRSRVSRLEALMAELSPCFAWFEPELMAIPRNTIDTFLADPALAFRKRALANSLRGRDHILSEPEERLLGQFSSVHETAANAFEILNDGDLTFGTVTNDKGENVELTHGTYGLLLANHDRAVREAAFRQLYTTYKSFRNTFAVTLDGNTRLHTVSSAVRRFPSALNAALFDENIPEAVYTQLIDSVHRGLPPLHRYLDLRRRTLKLDKLEMWDLYCPILPDFQQTYSWDEAVALVKDALKPLGDDYCRILDSAFSQRWLDVPERKGKRSGGYSGGCYDTYPYILLNFQGTLDDVFTLAHELGHSLHSYYSRATQPYLYSDYKIFVAEVASTTNEILLVESLLAKSDDPKLKACLLSHFADTIRTTIYRQTMFAEFELAMHRHAENGEPLTADLLDDEYYQLNETFYNLQADRLIALEWARIPHFYYNFYVYKYATSMSAAIKLANDILSRQDGALERYLGFLRAGDSKDSLDILRDAGVDLAQPQTVNAAVSYFESIVQRLETLLDNH